MGFAKTKTYDYDLILFDYLNHLSTIFDKIVRLFLLYNFFVFYDVLLDFSYSMNHNYRIIMQLNL